MELLLEENLADNAEEKLHQISRHGAEEKSDGPSAVGDRPHMQLRHEGPLLQGRRAAGTCENEGE